jgi:hypothetical protein
MDMERFHDLLKNNHSWPCEYTFKFIVAESKVTTMGLLLVGCEISTRMSSSGKYVSFTAKKVFNTPDEILAVYRGASKIEGVISL